jgi:hypothetical protein
MESEAIDLRQSYTAHFHLDLPLRLSNSRRPGEPFVMNSLSAARCGGVITSEWRMQLHSHPKVLPTNPQRFFGMMVATSQ